MCECRTAKSMNFEWGGITGLNAITFSDVPIEKIGVKV